MKILISGASGLIGSKLVPFLLKKDHVVKKMIRSEPVSPPDVYWNPDSGTLNPADLEGIDAVVHLAGENIAEGRWNEEKKQRIRDSRIKGTLFIAETLASLSTPPKIMVSGSAVGYYGDRGSETLTEESPPGNGFLPEVCVAWENATDPARQKGIRVVNLRTGIVLSPDGGALSKMLPPFKLGVGGKIGSGEQYMSWIAVDDIVGVIYHALLNDTLQGPVNADTPNPVTNEEFTKTLGRVLKRPTIFSMPAFAARAAFGEMADALLLASQRVEPVKLITTNYPFMYPDLYGALHHVLIR